MNIQQINLTVLYSKYFQNVINRTLIFKAFLHIVQDSLEFDMDKGIIWHCTLVNCTPSQSIGLFFISAVLVLCVSLCSFHKLLHEVLFHHDCNHNCWDFYGHSVHFELHIWAFCDYIYISGSMHFPGCLWPWTFYFNMGLNMLPSDWSVMFRFSTRIFYRGVPGFATDYPWSCLVYRIIHLPPACLHVWVFEF